jgi:hypothetical protein
MQTEAQAALKEEASGEFSPVIKAFGEGLLPDKHPEQFQPHSQRSFGKKPDSYNLGTSLLECCDWGKEALPHLLSFSSSRTDAFLHDELVWVP